MNKLIGSLLLVGCCVASSVMPAHANDPSQYKFNCPTGQTKNVLSAVCEGRFTGNFIWESDAPGYWVPRHHHRHHHWHHHHHH